MIIKLQRYFDLVVKGKAKTYATVKKINSSGTSRVISFIGVYVENDELKEFNLNYYIIKLLDYKLESDGNIFGVKINGCGMDMVFHLLYSLYQLIKENENKDYSNATRYELL